MQSWKKDPLPLVLLTALLAGVLVIIGGAVFEPGYRLVSALIWSFGFCASGMLLGFLFGIPRTLPSGTVNAPQNNGSGLNKTQTNDTAGPANTNSIVSETLHTSAAAPHEINSNLVEVSDWLTKIIVGVGLVELKNLPAAARSVAEFVAPSLEIADSVATPIAGGIMLYFSVLGFLIGYLLTRIYLAIIIKKADNLVKLQNEPIRLASGQKTDVAELTRLQQNAIIGLQETVAQLVLANPQNAAAATAPTTREPVAERLRSRVLWVDDKPRNNLLLVEQLVREDITVNTVESTKQALETLSRHSYDILITDMHRFEDNRSVPDAGVLLIQRVKVMSPELQSLVFCSKEMAVRYGAAAEAAGARLVTTSGTALIAVVLKILRAAGNADPET